ncbi:MAG: MgtC/SapB family protein [Oscillospiraceae bacterium]|nr:MgtC/SapB family protein [Oscillospiraceae bacterium]
MTTTFLSFDTYLTVLLRLVIAVILGALIGMERGSSKHDAGLRTHIIVALGAASTMITSMLIAEKYGAITDITRLGAQVISGIGFLGVGSIIVTKNRIRGLTTAAGLWTTACLGLVAGAGFLEVAITILLLILFTVYLLRPLSLKLRANDLSFEIICDSSKLSPAALTELFIKQNYEIVSVKVAGERTVAIVHSGDRCDRNEFIQQLLKIDGIMGISEI